MNRNNTNGVTVANNRENKNRNNLNGVIIIIEKI